MWGLKGAFRLNFIWRGKRGTMGPCLLALIRAQSRIELMGYTLTLPNYTMRGLTCPIVGQTIKWVFEQTSLWTDLHHWFATMENGALHLNHSNTSQALDLFFVLSWAIWSNINKLVHNDSPLSPPQVWTLANNSLEDFKNDAGSLDMLPPRHSQNRWEAPPQGVLKVNVDGATSNQGRNSLEWSLGIALVML